MLLPNLSLGLKYNNKKREKTLNFLECMKWVKNISIFLLLFVSFSPCKVKNSNKKFSLFRFKFCEKLINKEFDQTRSLSSTVIVVFFLRLFLIRRILCGELRRLHRARGGNRLFPWRNKEAGLDKKQTINIKIRGRKKCLQKLFRDIQFCTSTSQGAQKFT